MGFIIPTCKETLTNTIFLSTLKKGAKKKYERKKVESFPPKKKQIWCVHETCKIIFVEIFDNRLASKFVQRRNGKDFFEKIKNFLKQNTTERMS